MNTQDKPFVTICSADVRNYGSRRGSRIDTIVLHTTQGTLRSAVYWFGDPDAQASAHYVIGQDGSIVQCVPDDEAAWHAGNGIVNRRSIGIECEGDCARPGMWTPELIASLCALCRYLVVAYSIPIDTTHILGHADVPDPRDPTKKGGAHHHTDPGLYCPYSAVFDAVKNAVAMKTGGIPNVDAPE